MCENIRIEFGNKAKFSAEVGKIATHQQQALVIEQTLNLALFAVVVCILVCRKEARNRHTHTTAVKPLLKAHKSYGLIHKVVVCASKQTNGTRCMTETEARTFFGCTEYSSYVFWGRYPNLNRLLQRDSNESLQDK